MGRSRGARSAPVHAVSPPRPSGEGGAPTSPRSWRGVEFRTLPAGSAEARRLFAYAAVWAPPPGPRELVWGAWVKRDGGTPSGERMVGALVVERSGTSGLIHGPVVLDVDDAPEVAAQFLGALLPHATLEGIDTLFARPQGLDRVWVRLGFIPVPEADLPSALKGRPGAGLFAWRGGSALWSSRKPDSVEADRLR